MDKFYTLLFLLGGVLFLTGGERPNIVVIFADDMGYSDLGCFGGEIKTPYLDRLAENGIRYTQAYNTSKCWSSRISLLTGLYHHRSDRDFSNTALVGEILKPAAYRTWWAGKHHAEFNPHDRGFDHFFGFLGGAINFWNPGEQARQGEDQPGWQAVYTWAFDDKLVKPFNPEKDFFATDAFTDWGLNWLDEKEREQDPFFLFLSYNAPHWPLHAHFEDITKYDGIYNRGYEAIRRARYERQLEIGLFNSKTAHLSEPEHELWNNLSKQEKENEVIRMKIHAAMVDRMDQNIGRLVERLKKLKKFENTLIFFLVDNGASHEKPKRGIKNPEAAWGSVGSFEAIGQSWANAINSPFRKWKVQGLEGGICTPMIAHWPAGIKISKHSISRDPCHLIDFVPTFMELAGGEAKYPGELPKLDGISIIPTFSGKKLQRDKPLFFQYGSWQVIREHQWKLVQHKKGPWQLYDLSRDRTETQNLVAHFPERVSQMKKSWEDWASEVGIRE
ncbi:MAG: arylsulfatase [Verrucomicrobia bacterium TMED56]|nr:MAG: arylsulfatase [Verrucomicrobia bacterium TMED56]